MTDSDDLLRDEPRPIFLERRTQPAEASGARTRVRVKPKRSRSVRVARVVFGLWALAALVTLLFGVLGLRDAQRHLGAAQAELSVSDFTATATPSARATAKAMGRAHAMFSSPVLAPLKLVPVVGRQLRAVDALTGASESAIEIGIDARSQASRIAGEVPTNGPERLHTLAELRGVVRHSLTKLEKVDLGPSENLVGPIANTRATFAAELNRLGAVLQRADSGSAGLETFLKGPSRYAVFAANNAEMRAGSGMYLFGGTLEVANGELRLGEMKSILDLPPAPDNVALEYDYLRLWGAQAPGSDYRFVNMTPRFPTSGSLLKRMWEASGAGHVDGVLVVDPVAVVELMKVAGNVTVDGRTITPANALSLFLHDQYLETDSSTELAARRDFLGETVRILFGQLNASRARPSTLGTALGAAVAGRHMLAWADSPEVQRGWNALGMDGSLPDRSVMFALQNRGGTKLDYFQRISATAKATVSEDGSTIAMDFLVINVTPAGEPAYVAGPVPGSYVTTAGTYVGVASINVPGEATNVRLTGGDETAGDHDLVNGPDGNTQVVSKWIQLDRDERVTLRLEFSLPPGVRSLTVMPSARVPSILWHLGTAAWRDTTARTIRW